jgi:hypothetical protein
MVLLLGCEQAASRMEQSSQVRQLTATLLTEFTRAVDASNRAVMAESDPASQDFAREAERARAQVDHETTEVELLLRALHYDAELAQLGDFRAKFTAYKVLDQDLLGLAVTNSNLKATQLLFGPAAEAADTFKQELEKLTAAASGDKAVRIRALTFAALVGVREIQVLEAPHIAEPSDAGMTRMEETFASAEAATRRALAELLPLLPDPAALDAVSAALERFLQLKTEIVALSRSNTNVRSRALALGEKRVLVASCEANLRALNDSLRARASRPTR